MKTLTNRYEKQFKRRLRDGGACATSYFAS
jgi:hypothetical protein